MTRNFKGHLALFASSLIFGSNYWFAKGLMPVFITPAQIIFYRITTAALLFWLLSLFLKKEKIEKKDLIRIAYCSLLGVVINQFMFFQGLRFTKPVETALLHTSSPIVVLLFTAWILKERITLARSAGIILGAAGALFIVLNGTPISFSSDTFIGDIYIIINLTCYSLYLVLIKPVMRKYQPVTVMKWAFLFGAVVVTPFTFHTALQVNWSIYTADAWFSFFYVLIGSTFLAYLLITMSLQHLSPTIVGFYMYLQPLVAAVHGMIIHQEHLNWTKFLSALLIFSGVYLVNQPVRTKSEKMAERN
ncbi:MAG: DMT family transporter [Bacteroidetes bacterium]|nr:DMT family transporter [Bacteroidota bacterium]